MRLNARPSAYATAQAAAPITAVTASVTRVTSAVETAQRRTGTKQLSRVRGFASGQGDAAGEGLLRRLKESKPSSMAHPMTKPAEPE